jgi:multicomponent Na+:H+ antiporter subunit A
VLVFAYGTAYLTVHLEHEHRPLAERWRFWPWMLLFALAMIGLATAQDLVVLFVFFDLTAVCSYFLIGFDRSSREARKAALMALLVTVVSAVGVLIAAVLLYAEYGTFSIPRLVAEVRPGTTTTVAGLLLAVAALAKSAQVPLHFWLPRAMAAPTPVSAYLHSAAMVAAGVLLISRVHPLLARSDAVLTVLQLVGLVSIVAGGLLAFGRDRLKQVLAYSTISQYGYVVTLYGIGSATANGAAAFYVLAHGIAKSALFMTAGAVTLAADTDELSRLGGLARRMPVLATASGLAAATLAALPLTVGFFKDELFFKAALEDGPLMTVLAVVAAVLTFAYIGRFWSRIFLGPLRSIPHAISRLLVAPIGVLAVLAVFFGIVPSPLTGLAQSAGSVSTGAPVKLSTAYHLDGRGENLMALATYVVGGLLLAAARTGERVSRVVAVLGDRIGPRRIYVVTLQGLARISAVLLAREVRDLRSSIAAVLVPGGLLTALAFAATPTDGSYTVGSISGTDWLTLPLLVLVGFATLAALRAGARLALVLALAVIGFALAAVYALVAAPDVALVAVVVETMLSLVFLAALTRLPRSGDVNGVGQIAAGRPSAGQSSRPWRNIVAGVVAGSVAFATVWAFLSQPSQAPSVAVDQIANTPAAHGKDVVSVIVADFRGLDTLVEITVLLVAVIGVATLLRKGRLW